MGNCISRRAVDCYFFETSTQLLSPFTKWQNKAANTLCRDMPASARPEDVEDVMRSAINSCDASTAQIFPVLMNHCSHADFHWPNFFSFFLCFIPCTHSLTPKKSGVRRGFKVKWMDVIVAEENKTMRAYSKASWRCQKDIEVGQQISLSKYTSEGVTGGRRWAPPLKQSNYHKTFGEDVCRIFPASRAPAAFGSSICVFFFFGGGTRNVGLGPDF